MIECSIPYPLHHAETRPAPALPPPTPPYPTAPNYQTVRVRDLIFFGLLVRWLDPPVSYLVSQSFSYTSFIGLLAALPWASKKKVVIAWIHLGQDSFPIWLMETANGSLEDLPSSCFWLLIFSRPGRSQGRLYKHRCKWVIDCGWSSLTPPNSHRGSS